MATNNQEKNRLWYLREGWVYLMSILAPPFGLINILLHRDEWESENRKKYLGMGIFFAVLWSLSFILYLSDGEFLWIGINILVQIIIFIIILIWPKKK